MTVRLSLFHRARSGWGPALLASAALTAGACATARVPADAPPASAKSFEAVGRTYEVDFGGGNAFAIAFTSGDTMTFTKRQEPNKGYVETIHFRHRKLRDGLYLVYWQEADKTTVVHVEDFAQGVIHTNITRPDGSFFNGTSRLTRIK